MLTTNSLFPFSLVFPLASCLKAGDMVVSTSQNPPGVASHAQSVPSGVTPMQGSRHAGANPPRGPNPNHLDRQQQGNWPFFYVPQSQPYLPWQWPMPVPYVPYGGYPGLGRWSGLSSVTFLNFYLFLKLITKDLAT